MNKIININLAGRLIPIDEQAYDQLRDYLNRLKVFFSHEEGGDEIVSDMEDRIGELFQDKLKKGVPCIMAEDIQEMMATMGSPEQIEIEAGEENPKRSGKHSDQHGTSTHPNDSLKKKHLSRSRKEKIIGGVCGGLGAYFGIDPTIIRIALVLITLAWGAGLVVYLLLWAVLPTSDEDAPILRRRLYRNPKQKVVGGVCSGIAAYANVDPVIPRVIFAAPLLGLIFFGILDNGIFFFPMFVGGLPTLVLLYIILWASLPEATTVAEKLEMRGEKVDVQSLSQAIKGTEQENAPTQTKRSGLGVLFSVMVKIFVFFILGIILIVLASVVIAVIAALFGLAASSYFAFPFNGLITENDTQKWILWVCVMLTLLIPFVTVIRLLVRLVSGRPKKSNKWINRTQAVLFIAGIFGLFWIGSSIAADFKTPYRKSYVLNIHQPTNDTLIIKQRLIDETGIMEDDWETGSIRDNEFFRFRDNNSIAISNINLNIVRSPDSSFHLKLQKSAYGRNVERAKSLAEPLVFNYHQDSNTLFLPADFAIPEGHPFRGQKLSVELQVPIGKVFKTEDLMNNYNTDRSILVRRGNFSYTTRKHTSWADGQYFKMGDDGPLETENRGAAEEDEQ